MQLTPYRFAQTIEEASLNAWPAITHLLVDGWLLRFAGGYSRRNNSVNALYPGRLPLEEKIARCEAIYQARDLPPTFRLTPFVQPPELDDMLAQRGYRKVSPTSVQLKPLQDLPVATTAAEAHGWASPNDGWIDAYCRMNGVPPAKQTTLRNILDHIPSPACYMAWQPQDDIAACGLAVLEPPYAGLFDIVTDPARRGQGLGRKLVAAMLGWAAQRQATHAYLQVVADNMPALRLYTGLGFREIYQYWYRVPVDS